MDYSKLFNEKAIQHHLQLSMSGDAIEAGLQSLNNTSAQSSDTTQQKKKKSAQLLDLIELLTLAQQRLDNFIYELDIKLINAQNDLRTYRDGLAERLTLEHCLNVLGNNEILERDKNGHIKDQQLQNLIKHYVQEHNLNPDLLNDDAFVQAVAQNLIVKYPSRNQFNQIIALQEEKIETIRSGKEKAMELKEGLTNTEDLPHGVNLQKVESVNETIYNINAKLEQFDQDILSLKGTSTTNDMLPQKTIDNRSVVPETDSQEKIPTTNAQSPKDNMTF